MAGWHCHSLVGWRWKNLFCYIDLIRVGTNRHRINACRARQRAADIGARSKVSDQCIRQWRVIIVSDGAADGVALGKREVHVGAIWWDCDHLLRGRRIARLGHKICFFENLYAVLVKFKIILINPIRKSTLTVKHTNISMLNL